jgi:hypothetical protein
MRAGRTERGAALIIALLVMLVLSAMSMVALKASTESAWTSSTYRMTSQTGSFSDAVVQYGTFRSGMKAQSVYELIRRRADHEMINAPGDGLAELRRGGFQIYVPGEAQDGQVSLAEILHNGRLLEGATLEGLESELTVQYRYIVRDPIVGPPAPGFGENYCFNRVTVASEAIAAAGDGTRRRGQRTMGRHATEAFIGPIECGTQF